MKKSTITPVPVTDEIGELFNKKIDPKALEFIREILETKNMKEEDIKNAFDIICFLVKYSEGFVINGLKELESFHTFFRNEELSDKDCFSQILNDIVEELKIASTETDKEKLKIKTEVFIKKIYTLFTVANKKVTLSNDELYSLMKKILQLKPFDVNSENILWKNLNFIRELFEIPELKKAPTRLDIILNLLLEKQIYFISIMAYDQEYESLVIRLLGNSNFLSLDDEYYKKAVKILLKEYKGYFLEIPMNNPTISMEKKKIIIDYYDNILNKHKRDRWVRIEDEVKEPQYTVVCSERLLSMTDEEYRRTLEEIASCNKPYSYSMIITDNSLSETRRKIACNIIKRGEINEGEKNDENKDYKFNVATAAISPLLKLVSDEEYERILILINAYCEKAFQKNGVDGSNQYCFYITRANALVELLYEEDSYKDNMPRLIFAINEITNYSDNESTMEYIIRFCTHPYSVYYSEEEYKRILEIIRNPINKGKTFVLVSLFTNNNVPFMEDKDILFAASMSSEEEINMLTKKLNEEGTANSNIHNILNGVSEETRRILTLDNNGIGEAPDKAK